MIFTEIHSFHNTTEEQGELLFKYESKARKQERDILSLFPKGAYLSQYSARRAFERKYHKPLLVASCSRAFANLTKIGLLEKTDCRVMGEFNKEVLTWKRS